MIGYFIKSGDEQVSEMFTPYIWKDKGIGTLIDKELSNKTYGDGLKLILIQYYVEGRFAVNGPEIPTVGKYVNKDKSINVAITVKPNDFHNKKESDRKKYIFDTTINAIELVRDKLIHKKLNFDFSNLINDVKNVFTLY